MGDTCPYLEYRPLPDDSGGGDGDSGETGDDGDRSGGDGDGGETGDTGDGDGERRAYCGAVERFVQPMRADICNGRYGLDHETDCEFYRDEEGLPEGVPSEGAADEAAVRGSSGEENAENGAETTGDTDTTGGA